MVSIQNVSIDEYINPKTNTTCRLCMKKYEINEFEDLFNVFEPTRNETIAQHVTNFANIPISREDCFSNVICKSCLRKLNKIEHFKKVIFDCNALLNDLYSSYTQVKDESKHKDSNPIVIMFVPKEEIQIKIERGDDSFGNKNEPEDCDNKIDIVEHDLSQTVSKIEDPTANQTSINKRYKQKHVNYQCEICGKFYTNPDTFTGHIRRHKYFTQNTEQKCEICNKTIRSRHEGALRQHMKMHSKSRQQICPKCDKVFKTNHGYKAHLKSHNGELEFKCDQCPKAYVSKQCLKNHFDACHNTVKPYCCEICGKSFALQSGWYSHGKVHAKDNPFICTVCDKRFGLEDHLKIHMRAGHGIIENDIIV